MQKIMLAHGGGGQEMNDLINGLIFKIFNNEILYQNNDSAILNLSGKMAFSTDSFVVSPTKFPGGDIGKIAVCGTANDLAMVGAKPRYISCALIIEEGFDINELKDILSSMKSTADEAGVAIVCGDTKVVSKGSCDKIFINTSGVGEIIKEVRIENLKSGARVLLSGDVGRHGAVVLASRNELRLQSDLQSDCKPLYKIVEALLNAGITPLAMRDATRGGLSAVLNEWAKACKRDINIIQDSIAVSDEVMGICEILGFEPYELANEGTFVLAVEPKDEIRAVEILREFNSNANSIGEILDSNKSNVIIQNSYGATRFMEPPKGELLPRIC
ncbi:MAG: hydrogenase expression/formation protein HypE [Campylobacter hyointestinalis]